MKPWPIGSWSLGRIGRIRRQSQPPQLPHNDLLAPWSGSNTASSHAMNYHDGTDVKLGDIVAIPMPGGSARARVVWLGDTREHLEMDEGFIEWAENEKLLDPSQIVVEWIDQNTVAP